MYSMKILGLVVLGSICTLAFLSGYDYFREVSTTEESREQLFEIDEEIEHTIITGDTRRVEVEVPSGHIIKVDSNQLVSGGFRTPDNGYDMKVIGSDIPPGEHTLLISIENGAVNIEEVV